MDPAENWDMKERTINAKSVRHALKVRKNHGSMGTRRRGGAIIGPSFSGRLADRGPWEVMTPETNTGMSGSEREHKPRLRPILVPRQHQQSF